MITSVCVHANMPNMKYKNIPNKQKIGYNTEKDEWTYNIKKSDIYFIKTKGFGDFYDYLDGDKNFAFSTDCEYEFILNGKFIGYSGKDLKFYEFYYRDGVLTKESLLPDIVSKMFSDYKIIKLSSFSKNTNSIKIKKHLSDLNIILLNDSENDDITYENYIFTSGNAKFKTYDVNGFLTVLNSGMIQFSRKNDTPENWYIILVR